VFELLATVDPFAALLGSLWLFAAGMFPLGFMLGSSCSACCQASDACHSCCRDAVGQVVVDFELQATGEQTLISLPILSGTTPVIDGTKGAPQFIFTGQQSGAKVLARSFGNYTDVPGNTFIDIFGPFGPGYWSLPAETVTPSAASLMGAAFRTEFINGESVSVSPVGYTPEIVEQPSLTAVVGDCPVDYWNSLAVGLPAGTMLPNAPVSFAGSAGKWKIPYETFMGLNGVLQKRVNYPPVSSLTVDCQGDSGSVVFDVEDFDNRAPGTCEWCNPVIERSMAHPANRLLNTCDTWAGRYIGSGYVVTAETSTLSVAVPLMAFGKSSSECSNQLTASAITSWSGVAGGYWGGVAYGSVSRTHTYTLDRQDVDCAPLSGWTYTPPPPCDQYQEQLITLSATAPFGSGFSGIATEPFGSPETNKGPLAAVQITNSGSGYAALGRIAPTVTISGSGTGADLQAVLAQSANVNGLPVWQIQSVTIGPGGGGSGYQYFELLNVNVQSPGVKVWDAQIWAITGENGAITGFYYYGQPTGGFYEESTSVPAIVAPITIEITQKPPSVGNGATVTATVETDPLSPDFGEIVALKIGGGFGYAEPTLTATVSGGTGGVLSINGYSKIVGGMFDGYYVPTGISVVSGGSGYTDNAQVTLSLGTDDEWAPGSGAPDITIRTKIDPPGDDWTLTAYSADGMNLSAGVGLALSITLAPVQGVDGRFEATGVTITNGGTGYQVGEFVVATIPPDGDFGETAFDITSVDQNGAVTGLSIVFPGQHQGVDTGAISSVVISSNRASRKTVQLQGGGDGYLARRIEPSACVGPGGVYQGAFEKCGKLQSSGTTLAIDPWIWRRGCPDYTFSISIEPPEN